jgi:hypothetical protein
MAARPDDHRRRDHGAAGRGDADFIHADDALAAVVPEPAFVAEGRDDRGHDR